MSIALINFIALLNIKFAARSLRFTLPLRCKSSEKLVNLLFEGMHISSFTISKDTAPLRKNGLLERTVTIERLPSSDYIYFQLVSTPTRVIARSRAEVKYFERYLCGKLVVSTDAGLMFGADCAKRSIGGIVVCILFVNSFKPHRKDIRIIPAEYIQK